MSKQKEIESKEDVRVKTRAVIILVHRMLINRKITFNEMTFLASEGETSIII